MFVDLAVVWLITLLLGGLGLVLGLVAAAFFVWMATRKEGADRVFTWVFRAAVGCLGLFILVVTGGVFWLVSAGVFSGSDREMGELPGMGPGVGEAIRQGILTEGREEIRAGLEERGFGEIESPADARTALRETARVAEKVGFSAGETRELLEDAIPDDVPWADESASMVEEAMAVAYGEGDDAAATDTAAGDTADPPGAEPDPSVAMGAALPPAAVDTVATLLARLEDLEAEREALEIEADARDGAIDELEERLEDAEAGADGPGLWTSLQGLAETVGIDFGFFGWFVLYFAFAMPRLGGRTVGKRMFGIRVLQLDGSPINWFEAFERAGGYAAGVATGLLGFAQVYWDPNRQAIHDKIAGTVVIDERKPRVPGAWEKAVARPGRVDRGPDRKAGPGPEQTR